MRRKSIEQVAEAIESGKEDLKVAYKDIPERHRSIRAVFEHSYRLLSEEEQSAFIGLAVFRGGFTAEAAEKVAGATAEILDALVEHSLVRNDPEKERYDLHELVRQYAEEKLKTQGREGELNENHLRYFIDLGELIFDNPLLQERNKTFSIDVDNFRASMKWCTSNQQWEESLQLIGAVAGIWAVTSNWMEVDQWYKRILSSKQEFIHNRYLARAIQYAGGMVAYLDWDAAIADLKQSLSIWQEIGDKKGISATLYAIGDGYACQGKPKEAIIMLEESLVISRQINNQGVIASLLRYLSGLYLCIDYQNNLEKAQELCDKSLKIARQIGSEVHIAQCLATQGMLEMIKGNYFLAYKFVKDGLTLVENIQIPKVSLAGYLDSMGLANFYIGNYLSARACYKKAIEYTNQIGARNLESLCNLGYLLSRSGEYSPGNIYS